MGSLADEDSKPVGSYPSTGIDVLIVGTGLSGLTASLECVRKGHSVRVLERNGDINTQGDMYFMGQSATKFFRHWPEMAKEYEEISMQGAWIETFKHDGEQMIPPKKVADRLRSAGMDVNKPPGAFQMRPLVYKMFVRQLERVGVPVQFGKRVVDYYEDETRQKAGVITDQGERFEADIVIAADGVGSKSQKIVGGEVRALSSGRAMWRAPFPLHHLDKNPEVKKFFSMAGENRDEPIIRTFLGPGAYAMALTRRDTFVWLMNHEVTSSSREDWSQTVEPEEVLKNIDHGHTTPWAPIFKELIKITPSKTIVNFELFWRDPQPSWSSPGARVIQIGDCAHSFLPSSGNGATQAMEDAVSLATCLQIGGKENIPLSVQTHIKFRFVRCACAQKMGFYNAVRLQATNWAGAKINPELAQPKLPKWIWTHDPETYAYEYYHKMAETVKNNIPLDQIDNIPPNYPVGYKYVPWSLDEVMEDVTNGRQLDLGAGDRD